MRNHSDFDSRLPTLTPTTCVKCVLVCAVVIQPRRSSRCLHMRVRVATRRRHQAKHICSDLVDMIATDHMFDGPICPRVLMCLYLYTGQYWNKRNIKSYFSLLDVLLKIFPVTYINGKYFERDNVFFDKTNSFGCNV